MKYAVDVDVCSFITNLSSSSITK